MMGLNQNTDSPRDDHGLVNEIVYLASLASESKKIDSKLDMLRIVTADWDGKSLLSDQNRNSLTALDSELKNYLINEDPIRSFTAESLNERLQGSLASNKGINYFIPLALGESVIAAVLSILLSLSTIQKVLVTVTIMMQLFNISALWFYLSSLKNFKAEFRRVAYYLSIGILGINIGILPYSFTALSQKVDHPLFRYGGWPEGAAIGFIIIYIGLVKYANTLKITTKKDTGLLIIAHLVMLPVVGFFAAIRGVEFPIILWLSSVSMISIGITAFFGARIISRILKLVTSAYTKSLRVLLIYFLADIPGVLAFGISLLILGHFSVKAFSILFSVAGVPLLAILMYSGYSFKKETSK